MPTPHLTPQISAGAMRKLTTDLLRLWRSEGRGGVTLTKSRAKWVLEAAVSALDENKGLSWSSGTYASFRHTNEETITLGNFPGGDYVGAYGGGAFQYARPFVAWDVNEQIIRIIYNGGISSATSPSIAGQASIAAAEAAFRALNWAPVLSHEGGSISVYFFDNPYDDNILADGFSIINGISAQPPLFGIRSPLPRLVLQDQPANDSGPFITDIGLGCAAPMEMLFSSSLAAEYKIELDIEIRIPEQTAPQGGAGTDRLMYGDWTNPFNPPPTYIQSSGLGAEGEMSTLSTTVSDTITTDGITDVTRYFVPFWVDGMARTGCYFEVKAIRVISRTLL